jgi:hypothetical protein
VVRFDGSARDGAPAPSMIGPLGLPRPSHRDPLNDTLSTLGGELRG